MVDTNVYNKSTSFMLLNECGVPIPQPDLSVDAQSSHSIPTGTFYCVYVYIKIRKRRATM